MLKIFLFTSLPFYLFTSLPVFGETQALFSPEGKIRDHILKRINGCSSSIEIAVYDFTSGDIAEALVNAKNRGVKIRLVMDKKQAEKEGSLYGFLKDEGFDVLLLKGRVDGSMHNSFVVFDNKLVLTGSYNWTEYAEKFNYENAILTDEKAVVKMYQDEFKRLYVPSQEPASKGGATPPLQTQDSGLQTKEFIDISFKELDKIFGNESPLSRSEKNEKWKQYRGKYVRWTGEVAYRGIGRTDWNRMGIMHTGKVDVELWFDYRMMNKVLNIKEGQVITYTGMLSSRRGYSSPYRITDGWIEEYHPQKTEQQGDEGQPGGKK
ncbi:MAG TPA: phospholipase D-like domain-containing protein [Candidatus Brocadiales bacterium]|nr:phospholipase D-like domain-containing protein [Candidatus Brocadiales bacterium]